MLSKNLSLREALHSGTAKRLGISNIPTPEHLENLRQTAENIFQPLRNKMKCPIYVSSGYRSEELNKAIGGSTTSQHCKGEAFDLDADMYGKITNKDIFYFIKDNLTFDQLIWEFGTPTNPAWVHVSYRADGNNRGEILKASKKNGRTHYSYWNEG